MFCRASTFLLLTALPLASAAADQLVWPPAPDEARVRFVEEIRLGELSLKSGFFSKLTSIFAGGDENSKIGYPFDLLAERNDLYLVCQDLPALVRVDLDKREYSLIRSERIPMVQPVSLSRHGDDILVSDSANGIIYRYSDGELKAWITEGLVRPTGLAALRPAGRVCVVDTGDHSIKIFGRDGGLLETLGARSDEGIGFNYPTFAVPGTAGEFLVNDTLNYSIKRFGETGELLTAFGSEGDGPGSFARPKGVAVDSRDFVYVVDALFDNLQIFDRSGRLLLVIGSRGDGLGEFWSPAGISIREDRIYVADTFNDRVQVLEYVGGEG